MMAKETQDELQIGKEMRVSGVPHFVLTNEAGATVEVSGRTQTLNLES